METTKLIKELTYLQEQMLKMREDGDTDLRGLIDHVETLIMAIENK